MVWQDFSLATPLFILQGDDVMDDIIKKCIDNVVNKTAKNTETLSADRIKKAGYDKTLIGWVSQKIVPENPKDDSDFKWRIQTNGVAYDIKPSACNITSVGQRVRLYVPNHSYKDKYAEVIDNADCTSIDICDDKITFTYSNSLTEEVTLTRDSQNKITSFTYYGKTMEVKRNGK